MGNMSYCRFENTSRDLEDCLGAIQEGEYEGLTSTEASGLRRMLSTCEEILSYEEEITDIISEE